MKASELRRAWTAFFAERDHVVVPAAGLIPHHPTAPMFTNSGMMQFVPYFLGEEQPPFRRAQSIQKCVRISGKHNDVDELGRTNRHLSFFEMMGNWSFGDYFKEDAIRWSWDLLQTVGIDVDRLWVTVHESDDEAEAIWHEQVGFPLERIQRMGKENFWEMGETGPCGPSTEMHFDLGPDFGPGGGPAVDTSDRYIELWNDVFMTSFREPDGSLVDLPSTNVDTGAGLERWLMVLDGAPTVFDTDALRPLIAVAESFTGRTYRAGEPEVDVALRVMADHARTMTFLVNDGVIPSNEGRGYVLRGVIRRAVRRAYSLGVEDKVVLPELVLAVVDHMAEAYPDLRANADGIAATIEREEGRFRQTLKAGSVLLGDVLESGQVDGEVAFKLHDTFGFPIEITEEIAAERGVEVDRAGFEAAMDAQRTRSRDAARRVTLSASADEAYRRLLDEQGPTVFTGRDEDTSDSRVLAVLPGGDGGDDLVEIFLDRSPFYAESGGQVGDTGIITTATGRAEVLDTTFALPGLERHTARVVDGTIEAGDEATAAIDAERRAAIRRNHTATHLLHWALRQVLGEHVKQQGSEVGPDRLRFDFSHHEAVSPADLREVERLANLEVLANDPVVHDEMPKEQALAKGAIAFFGDKYGDVVRVLQAGRHSTELCGGTHVHATGDIGPIRILSEGSIGANQRRIFATTGLASLEGVWAEDDLLDRTAEVLGVSSDELVDGAQRARDEIKDLRAQLRTLQRGQAAETARDLAATAVDGVVVARVDGTPRDELRELALAMRDRPGIRAVVLGSVPDEGGVALVSAVSKEGGLHAGELLADAARTVGGGGGKQGDVATAGGRHPEKLDEALAQARAAAGLA
ncbi:MAG TPA: alanine--tRNA ligase [Acidimicrobiales bacterium]|jgi:alanyl-tRNA synthetase